MDDAQMQQHLGLMRLPPGTRITNQIAHEICLRDGAAATIDGSIASLGKSYVVTVQAVACYFVAVITLIEHRLSTGPCGFTADAGQAAAASQMFSPALAQRIANSLCIACIGWMQNNRNKSARFQIHCVFGFVRQMGPAVFPPRDPGIRIVRIFPIVVGTLLWTLPVKLRQLFPRRRFDAELLCQTFQEML